MKRNNLHVIVITLMLLMTASFGHATQLSGNYMIDSAGTATATTFKNLASAVTYLTGSGTRTDGGPSNSGTFGVSGPVVFIVQPGTYTGQVTITGNIPGASLTNTVTFQGTNAATCIVTYASASTTSRHTVKLDNVKYVTFRNLTIRATGTNGWPVHITTANCNANRIKSCIIDITGTGTTSNSTTNFAGIVINGSTSTPTTGIRIDSLEIDSNTINYGYYGIVCVGLSGNLQQSNKFRNNKIYGSYQYGIYDSYQDGALVSGNVIIPRAGVTASVGIAMLNSGSASTNRGIEISNNRISNYAVNGIIITASQNSYAGTRGRVFNNMIGGGLLTPASFGINMATSNFWEVSNNTVNMDLNTTAVTNAALYIASGLNINVINNLLSQSKGGLGLPLYVVSGSSLDTLDYNQYYRADTSNNQLLYVGGSYFNTGNFKTALGHDSNSVFSKPFFVNDTNLHIYNSCAKGLSRPFITADIDGTARGVQPVIGAHEAASMANNISALYITAPLAPISTGVQNLGVKVQNSGSNTVTSFNVTYRKNNGTPVTVAWTGTLAPCDTTTVTFSGANSINITDVNYITVYTSQPNAATDANRNDDTLSLKYYGVLNGNYTIGGSGSDFATLSDATDALKQRGIAGPVKFTLSAGTYNTQVIVSGPVTGTSAVNTITFDGVNAATRIITSQVGSGATVLLNLCDHVALRNLTIANTSATGNCTAVGIIGNNTTFAGSSNSVKQCIFNLPNNASGTTAYGVMVTGSSNGYATSDNRVDSVEIDSNTFNGVNCAVYVSGNGVAATAGNNAYNRGYKVRYNTINATSAQGDNCIYFNNTLNGFDIIGNTINAPGGTAVYIYQCLNHYSGNAPHRINANKIRAGQVGLNIQNITSLPSNPTQFCNNDIVMRSTLAAVGIYFSQPNANQVDMILHNTVLLDSASSPVLGYGVNYGGSNASVIRNNIFAFTGTGTATIYPLYITSGVSGRNLNHNVYHNAAIDSLVFRNGNSYGTANMIGASAGGDSSFNLVPSFVSNTDVHLTSGCPRGADHIAAVPTDRDGVARSFSPSIGAYEFTGFANDMALTQILQPSGLVSTGPQDLKVKVSNNGNNSVTSFNVSYRLNNGTPVTQAWSGLLLPCDTTSVIFTGGNSINISSGITAIKVYTSQPNGITDGNRLNDTISAQFAPPLNGNYVIGTAPSDYTTVTAAASALVQRGVSGPVNFSIRSGIYAETVNIPGIAGASPANTITFRSMAAHRDSVVIRNNTTTAYVFSLAGASYITIKDLSLDQQNNDNFSSCFMITGNASFDTLQNCKISMPAYSGNNTMCIYTSGLSGKGFTVKNSLITGGAAGILSNPFEPLVNPSLRSNNITVTGNAISNVDATGAYFYGAANLLCDNNTITTNTSNTSAYGIQCTTCDSSWKITRNKIRGVAGGNGIYVDESPGSLTRTGLIANNDVSVGQGTNTTWGIGTNNTTFVKVHHNSVNVLSTGFSYAASFAGAASIDVRNNNFASAGYAINTSAATQISSDYNNLYSSGTNLGRINTVNYATFQAWKTAAGSDKRSVSVRPGFTSNTDLRPLLSDSITWMLNGHATHVAGDSTDMLNNPRPDQFTAGAPDLGAYEFTPTALPPAAVATPTVPAQGTTQVFISFGDTIAKITWDAVSAVPSSVTVRQYSGVKPPNTGPFGNYMYFYTNFVPQNGAATYGYNLGLYYRDAWRGTVPAEADARLVQKDSALPWYMPVSVNPDTSRNILNGQFIYSVSMFSGTDVNSPLPVKLLQLGAKRDASRVLLSWKTASEENSDRFLIERSTDNGSFKQVGTQAAAGNSNTLRAYSFTDEPNSSEQTTLYYRLKMFSKDGTFQYSNSVQVDNTATVAHSIVVYPNPFSSSLKAAVMAEGTGAAHCTLTDLAGKTLSSQEQELSKGLNEISLKTEALVPGVYFLVIESEGNRSVHKVIRQ